MFGLEAQTIGVIFVILALLMIGMVYLITRSASRSLNIPQSVNNLSVISPKTQNRSNEAILFVQIGGRVIYTNHTAQDWFKLQGKKPNLERLALQAKPRELFLKLCSSPGQERISMNGRLVEGSSYYVPGSDAAGGYLLVSLRRLQIADMFRGINQDTDQTLDILSELNQIISPNPELDQTLEAILESVGRMIPADIIKVAIWDNIDQCLVPHQLIGVTDGNRQLERAEERTHAGQGYGGKLISTHQSLLIPDVGEFQEISPEPGWSQYPIKSYLGAPLIVADELVGTLELASLEQDAFSQDDVLLVKTLASQAAVALHTALMFMNLQKQLVELTGFAKLSQTTGWQRNPQEFFSQLMDGIVPLVQVGSIGFLIYDDARRRLAAQAPFIGIPAEFVNVYQVTLPPGSQGEEIWLSQQMITAYPASEDAQIMALGMSGLVQAAGLTNVALLPLISGGRMLGYLQAADKLDGQLFSPEDIRILTNISSQSATVIENLLLVKQSQERALRSETMRRIASLTGSVATVDEILAFSLRELARLLRVDMAAILLTDESRAELRVHPGSLYGVEPDVAARIGRISMNAPEYLGTVTGSQRQLFCDDISKDALIAPIYRLISDVLGLNSLINVPVIVRENGIGEVLLGSRKAEFFDPSDLILLTTTASQIASAIEKSSLYSQTDETLQRRVEQLTAFARISRELNTNIDLRSLLQLVYNELLRTTQANCGFIGLFHQTYGGSGEKVAFMRVGNEGDQTLSPLETKVMAFEESIIVQDYGKPIPMLGNIVASPPHTGIVSSLVVPISYQEGIAGLIHLHSNQADHFDTTALEITQTLATQAAIALGNASRYYEQRQRNELLGRRVETIEKLMDAAQSLSPEQPLEISLDAIAYGIQESTTFNHVIIGVYQPQLDHLTWLAAAGLPLDTVEEYRLSPIQWSMIREKLNAEYCFGRVYFIPVDGVSYQPPESIIAAIIPSEDASEDKELKWKTGDTLLVVLNDSKGHPLGLIQVDQPRDGKRPDLPAMETLEIFASQASLVIESRLKLEELDRQLKSTQFELDQANITINQKQAVQPKLLEADVDVSKVRNTLSHRSDRIQAGLNIAELVYRQTSRSGILQVLGQETLKWMDLDNVLIAESRGGNPRLTQVFGVLPESSLNLEVLLGQRNPLQFTLQNGTVLSVPDLHENKDWGTTALLDALNARSFICLPIQVADGADFALLMVGTSLMPPIPKEEGDILEVLCRQAGVALEKTHLLDEMNQRYQEVNLLLEFSRQLGSLEPLSILQSLADISLKAIPHANTGLVALWQADEQRLVPQVAVGYNHNERMLKIKYLAGQALPGKVYANGEAILVDEINFTQQYNLPSEYLMAYRDATEGRLPISSLVMPIRTSENTLGVLILDNFQEAAAFTIDDQNIAGSLTRQTALTLEHSRLYQAAEQRAIQLQALTNVAGTITSSLHTDEVINLLLGQVRMIIPYDTGTLWLRRGDELLVRAASGFEDSDQRSGLVTAIKDSLLLKEMIGTSQPILVGDVRLDPRFPALIEPSYLTWLGIPLISKGQVVGVIALEKEEANFYSDENIRALVTFAGQAAVALENARLFEESNQRAAELDERSQRLTLLNRLSAELSSSLDLDYILNLTLCELTQAVTCDSVSAVLFDANVRPVLEAELPAILKRYPLPLPDCPIFDRMHETSGIFLTDDVFQEEELKQLQDFFAERSTKALLVLPLATGRELHGLLLAQSTQTLRFEVDEVELARTISNQAAVAIQNARLFQETEQLFSETQQRSAELSLLFELGVNITQVLDQNRLIDATFENVTRMLGADTCGLVLVSPEEMLELQALDRGERIGPMSIPRSGTSFSEYVLKTGEPLFIRDLDLEHELLPVPGYTLGEPVKSWLGVPLVIRSITIGVLSVQSYHANAFGEAQVRLLGQVGNQLSVALDNARMFENTAVYAADMAQRVSERTRELEVEHTRTQTLLRIITELSASLDQDMVLNRTLAILNETIEAEYSMILLVNPENGGLYLRSWLADKSIKSRGKHTGSWKSSEPLARWVIAEAQAALIPDLVDDKRWLHGASERSGYHSAIAVPLLMGEECLGAMLLFHRQVDRFTQNALELVQATAKQIAVSINNTQLFNLIRDQAERLGELLRTQHVETSRSQAMLEAVADGVLVTDAQRVITLFNASAEKILGLDRTQVVGQSLENFMGLFGRAAQEWVHTIDTWSQEANTRKMGEFKSAQIELDDQRVVSIHLSPVLLRNDFLGTVSIFQDITHLIELDRLKSEFVATVSHELRTPMTSIKGYVEILLMGAAGTLNDSQMHFLQVVRSNTDRLSTLVNDLLDISRIEAGRVTLSQQPIEPQYIIRNSLDMITRRSSDEGRAMTVNVEIDTDLPPAYGDRERVQQILDNLVQNAYQYTPDGGQIILRAQVVEDTIQFSVQDTGIGIPHENHPRIFERFFRGENPLVLATSGTGLGLSIVKHLVEMHGGRIWFESPGVQGLGSTFLFTIPRYVAEKSENHMPLDQTDTGRRE
jgi:PAS domain S-box-containing protein